MKKIKLSSEACCIISVSAIQGFCIVVASAFMLQQDTVCPFWVDIFGSAGYLLIAAILEVVKFKHYIKRE